MDLAQLLAPRSRAHADEARRIWQSRDDLQRVFPQPEDAAFAEWLGVHGLREYPRELAAHYPPIPPHELRSTASCGTSADVHLQSGVADLRIVGELWEIFAERPFTQLGSVLDFGCGCGRLLRWFQTALPGAHRFGADVRRASIEWCQQNLDGTFVANDIVPPLPLPDASVDLVVALSVFSHLNVRSARAWMRELARVCKPGGLLLVTAHGAFALALLNRSAEHRAVLGVDAATACDYLRRLEREHFVFHPVADDIVRRMDGVESEYGQVFFDATFVREQLRDSVELLGVVPAALQLWQDFFALRPRR
jgi:SAM-dependent methyltransferase